MLSKHEMMKHGLKGLRFVFWGGSGTFGLFGFFVVSHVFPQDVLNNTILLSHMFCPKFHFQHKVLFWGGFKKNYFNFVVLGQLKWIVVKTKKLNMGRTPLGNLQSWQNQKLEEDEQNSLLPKPTWNWNKIFFKILV